MVLSLPLGKIACFLTFYRPFWN